ncbi:hypothetical protein PENTCL1PPCAC_24247, partial [Pristionchus entomophagus]
RVERLSLARSESSLRSKRLGPCISSTKTLEKRRLSRRHSIPLPRPPKHLPLRLPQLPPLPPAPRQKRRLKRRLLSHLSPLLFLPFLRSQQQSKGDYDHNNDNDNHHRTNHNDRYC